jgi:ADP-heptose:LPS heptosyltransferase
MTHVLVARLDNDGDVLLTGPAVRAVAASGAEVTFLCRPASAEAAGLLPGVTRVVTFDAGWISAHPAPIDPVAIDALVAQVAAMEVDQALIMTSFHQSPLPMALLLRLSGVPTIAANSEDYPGSLLDVRHRPASALHEVERNLSLVATLGYSLPANDDGRLAIRLSPVPGPLTEPLAALSPGYVVLHPGASVPARSVPLDLATGVAQALVVGGRQVVVTGGPGEWAEGWVWPPGTVNLVGSTDVTALARVLSQAAAIVVGNTGPAHLAAAVATPVVSIFAPTVPLTQWHPWGVPYVALGDQDIGCRQCRSRTCPVLGQPCTARISVGQVLSALERLIGDHRAVA